ncbi:MAG: SNF2-related protein [Veillonellaceae bacterium]|nr:SNF2-related protein [Veillonellaceae bacterium]
MFNSNWNDASGAVQDVTDILIEHISHAYNENAPEFLYFVILYNLFKDYLENVSEDDLPNEAYGFKSSKIWNLLFQFQKDAVLGIIQKLEQYNGCILADSVGLGKTYTALAVIKYYQQRNKSILVLCPKKLAENWNTYRDNYKNNPVAGDRLNYTVLFHTDLSREKGISNGINLARINWQNYDLVVIDESHNFRNGEASAHGDRENRYMKLMRKVMRGGVRTKVLMLSATPVNNKFSDLKNQLALAYEGDAAEFDEKLETKTSIDQIFRQAQKAYNEWCELPLGERKTERLLRSLSFDFSSCSTASRLRVRASTSKSIMTWTRSDAFHIACARFHSARASRRRTRGRHPQTHGREHHEAAREFRSFVPHDAQSCQGRCG